MTTLLEAKESAQAAKSYLMPTKNPDVFIFMFACPIADCEFEYEATVRTVGTKSVMQALCLSHVLAHARPF